MAGIGETPLEELGRNLRSLDQSRIILTIEAIVFTGIFIFLLGVLVGKLLC